MQSGEKQNPLFILGSGPYPSALRQLLGAGRSPVDRVAEGFPEGSLVVVCAFLDSAISERAILYRCGVEPSATCILQNQRATLCEVLHVLGHGGFSSPDVCKLVHLSAYLSFVHDVKGLFLSSRSAGSWFWESAFGHQRETWYERFAARLNKIRTLSYKMSEQVGSQYEADAIGGGILRFVESLEKWFGRHSDQCCHANALADDFFSRFHDKYATDDLTRIRFHLQNATDYPNVPEDLHVNLYQRIANRLEE